VFKKHALKYNVKVDGLITTISFIMSNYYLKSCIDAFFVHYSRKKDDKQIQINYLIRILTPKIITIQITTNNILYSTLPSLSNYFKSLIWAEREIFDMSGTLFSNHPDLRRILSDYGTRFYPLLKSFNVVGLHEKFYSYTDKLIVSRKVKIKSRNQAEIKYIHKIN